MPRAFLTSVWNKKDTDDMYVSFYKNQESYNKFREILSRHLSSITIYVVLLERMRRYKQEALDIVKKEAGKKAFVERKFDEFDKLNQRERHVYKKQPESCFAWLQEHSLKTFRTTIKLYQKKKLDDFKHAFDEYWSREFSFVLNTENSYPEISQEDTYFVQRIYDTDDFEKLARFLSLGSINVEAPPVFPSNVKNILWKEEANELKKREIDVQKCWESMKQYEQYERIYQKGKLEGIASDWNKYNKFILKISNPASILAKIESDCSLSSEQKTAGYESVILQARSDLRIDQTPIIKTDEHTIINILSGMLQKALEDAKVWKEVVKALKDHIDKIEKVSDSFIRRMLLKEKRKEWLLVVSPDKVVKKFESEVWQTVVIDMLKTWPDRKESIIRKPYCSWMDVLSEDQIKKIDLSLLLRYKKYGGNKWWYIWEERVEQEAKEIWMQIKEKEESMVDEKERRRYIVEKEKELQSIGYQLIGSTHDLETAVRENPAYFDLENDVSYIETFKLTYTLVTYGLARRGEAHAVIRAVLRADLDDIEEANRLLDELGEI